MRNLLNKAKAKFAVGSAVVVGTVMTSSFAQTAEKVTVDMPEVDLSTVSVWLGGIAVVVLSVGAIFFGTKNGKSFLKGG